MRLSKSTYYFEVSKDDQVAIRNEELTKEIIELFNKHKGRYGVRRIYHALKVKDSTSITNVYNELCILMDY